LSRVTEDWISQVARGAGKDIAYEQVGFH